MADLPSYRWVNSSPNDRFLNCQVELPESMIAMIRIRGKPNNSSVNDSTSAVGTTDVLMR